MILIDAGALLAILNRRDRRHDACVRALRDCREPLATAWPVFAQAIAIAGRLPAAQEALWETVARQAIRLLLLTEGDAPRLRELMIKHRRRRISLAQAALVRIAEREHIRTLFTLETAAFNKYRIGGRHPLRLIPGSASGRL